MTSHIRIQPEALAQASTDLAGASTSTREALGNFLGGTTATGSATVGHLQTAIALDTFRGRLRDYLDLQTKALQELSHAVRSSGNRYLGVDHRVAKSIPVGPLGPGTPPAPATPAPSGPGGGFIAGPPVVVPGPGDNPGSTGTTPGGSDGTGTIFPAN